MCEEEFLRTSFPVLTSPYKHGNSKDVGHITSRCLEKWFCQLHIMEEAWDFAFLSRISDSCMSFVSEFVDDWLSNDMRVCIFKILLGWLLFSLIAIHFAWKVYGNTVNDMYYRQGEIVRSFDPCKSCVMI